MSARSPRPSRFCASTPATKDAEPTHALFQSRQDKRERGVSTKDTSSRGGTPASIHTHSSPQLLHPTARMLGFCALHPRGARHSHLSPPPTPHHLHHHKARLNHFLRHSTDSENSRAPPLLHSPCSATATIFGTSKLTHVTSRAFVSLRDHPLSHTHVLSLALTSDDRHDL